MRVDRGALTGREHSCVSTVCADRQNVFDTSRQFARRLGWGGSIGLPVTCTELLQPSRVTDIYQISTLILVFQHGTPVHLKRKHA